MNNDKIRWGILGCADIAAKALIPGLLESENGSLQAIASRGRDKLAEFDLRFHPVRCHLGYDELLADKAVEAVYIPLPNGLHREWVLKAAQAGKHVLCEKPLGLNAGEAAEMHAACRQAGVFLMEAFAYRHSPLTREVKRLVDSGAIGALRSIESGFSFRLADRRNVRYEKAQGGGATYDVGCYNLDLIRYLAGRDPLSVQATGTIDSGTGIDLSSSAVLDFGTGLTAVSVCSFDAAFRSDYRVVGTGGAIKVDSPFNAKGDLAIELVRDGQPAQTIRIMVPDNYRLEVEQLGRCIRGGETPLMDEASSLATARLIDAVLARIGY
jgi:predicted dehydrogenase